MPWCRIVIILPGLNLQSILWGITDAVIIIRAILKTRAIIVAS